MIWLLRGFLIVCSLFFGVLSYVSLQAILERAGVDWRQTPATVVSSRVEAGAQGYCPRLTYSYEVAQQAHQKSSLYRGRCFRERDGAAKIVARYPPGRSIIVFYPPARPDDATLYTGVGWTTYFGAAVSLLVCLGCAALLLPAWSRR